MMLAMYFFLFTVVAGIVAFVLEMVSYLPEATTSETKLELQKEYEELRRNREAERLSKKTPEWMLTPEGQHWLGRKVNHVETTG